MRILVSGGGTAGHISPILATLDELRRLDKSAEILYAGTRGGLEQKIAVAHGLEFAAISAGKFRRLHGARLYNKIFNLSTIGPNTRDVFRAGRGVVQSVVIIRRFKPDVVFIKGGFVGLPVGLAAGLLKVPYVIHESDVEPGLANRILSKRAAAIATGFPADRYKTLPAERLHFVGNPVRPALLKAHRLEGLAKFKLEPDRPVVLVTGGSQGAQRINDAIIEALPELSSKYQLIHLTGDREIERIRFEVKRAKLKHPERYQAHAFLQDEMGAALAASDLVISRAGANTIAELAALKKPTILIPNQDMAGHQLQNATVLARQGAVRVIQEDKLTPQVLVREVDKVLGDDNEQAMLSKHIAQLAQPEADRKLAELILKVGKEGERAKPEVADAE